MRDTSSEVELRAELRRQAATDPLTGLPNRRALTSALERAAASGDSTAMLLVDVDSFKSLIDLLGHVAGDELLVQVASRLRAACPDSIVIRLGGDEFAVVVRSVESEVELEAMAWSLLDQIAHPFCLDGRTELVRISVGAAVVAPADVDSLVHRADVAMYVAKRSGGAMVVVYRPEFEEEAAAELHVERALSGLDYDDEFHLVFQPIVRSTDAEVIGLEALLRWDSPDLGSVRPDLFIPIAERTGEIGAIGRWVLNQACQQVADWAAAGLGEDLTVSVNVSPYQLDDDDFVPFVLTTLAEWGVPPGRLAVEVTESVAIQNTAVASRRLGELRDAGVSVSIDDFGDGFSNLGQLLQVPFDTIKVDRSLLLMLGEMSADMVGDPDKPFEIMQAIVSIASATGASVVCEGVEEEEQRASLVRSGVDYVQGYLTGRPQTAAAVEALLRGTERLRLVS